MKKFVTNIKGIVIVLITLGGCGFQPGENTIAGFEMIGVEGDTFEMGNTMSDDEGEPDEIPVHSVTLSNYYIGKTLITQKQFYDVMGFLPYNLNFGKGDEYPVCNLSWDDIKVFLRRLNKKTGKKFRLPTEAEWEFACKGGKKSANYRYSGSNEIKTVAWYCENSCDKQLTDEEHSFDFLKENNCTTHPVGKLKPNELGIYDMTGNVWEWCFDLFDEYPTFPQKNPVVKKSKYIERVIRGGGFADMSAKCRISNRGMASQITRTCDLGLRLVHSE